MNPERTAYKPLHFIGDTEAETVDVEQIFYTVYNTEDDQVCIDGVSMMNSAMLVNSFLTQMIATAK